MEYCALLPKEQVPEHTELYEGFIHLDSIQGNVEHTTMQFIIRDHDKELFQRKKELMGQAASYINAKYPSQPLTLTVKDTYYNMKEKILPRMDIIETMERAMRENGVEPITLPIRGGTDAPGSPLWDFPAPTSAQAAPTPTASWSMWYWRTWRKLRTSLRPPFTTWSEGSLCCDLEPSARDGFVMSTSTGPRTAVCGN